MPSLNQKHRAADLLRQAARTRLEREAAERLASTKPVLSLFHSEPFPEPLETGATAPGAVEEAMQATEVAEAVSEAPTAVEGVEVRIYDPEKCQQRYVWRVLVCKMFGRKYLPDAERAKAAREFAYKNKARIRKAFDKGKLKAEVIEDLEKRFRERCDIGLSPSPENWPLVT